jgi:hypothetical protein
MHGVNRLAVLLCLEVPLLATLVRIAIPREHYGHGRDRVLRCRTHLPLARRPGLGPEKWQR